MTFHASGSHDVSRVVVVVFMFVVGCDYGSLGFWGLLTGILMIFGSTCNHRLSSNFSIEVLLDVSSPLRTSSAKDRQDSCHVGIHTPSFNILRCNIYTGTCFTSRYPSLSSCLSPLVMGSLLDTSFDEET